MNQPYCFRVLLKLGKFALQLAILGIALQIGKDCLIDAVRGIGKGLRLNIGSWSVGICQRRSARGQF